ncbi:MAG: hypothetical protein ACREH5_06130 [Candidatus Omnitrophota bacterium]
MSPVRPERPSLPKGEGLFISHPPFLFGALILGALILSLYSVSLGHNFLFDEENIILRNPLIRSLSLIPELFMNGYFYFEGRSADWQQYYRPLTSATFAIDHFFWKFNPFGYNLTNVFLHILVSALFFALLSRAFGAGWPAFLTALVWSVHTIHTEAVTYTASRGDLLGALLMLAVFLLYWHGRSGMALAVFGLALFAKESLMLLPLYLVALEISFVRSGWKKSSGNIIAFFIVAVFFFVFRRFFSPVPLGPPSNDLGQAVLRVLSMGEGFTEYLRAVFFPEAFKFCRSFLFAPSLLSGKALQTLAMGVLLAAGWFVAFRRRGAAFFGMTLFLAGLLPYSQVVHFYPEWAEHYLYIPSMGLAFLLGSAMTQLPRRLPAQVLSGLLAAYFAFFGFLCFRTWQRNAFYADTERYYRKLAASDSPYAYYGYQNLARLLIENGAWEEALVPLKTALAIEPRSDVTNNLMGLYCLEKKRLREAIRYFEDAYRYSGDLKYLVNAGTVLVRLGEYPEAVKIFETIHAAAPKQLSVYTNLMAVWELAGDARKARAWGFRGLKAFEGQERETVVLSMGLARLAYRQDWTPFLQQNLNVVLDRYPDAFWYGDLAKLFSGKMTPDAFLAKAGTDYPAFTSAAKVSVLLSYVIAGEFDAAGQFYAANRDLLDAQAASHPLIAREIEKAKEAFGRP